jgi:hypothetical protein
MKKRITFLPLGLLAVLALLAGSLAACNNHSSSPTEPASMKSLSHDAAVSGTSVAGPSAADAVLDEKRGNGNGNGNGHGHGHGGDGGDDGNGHGNHGGTATLQIQPDVWNLNTGDSHGTVSALVRGIDVTKLDSASVQLVVGSGSPISPLRIQTAGGQLRAFFAKSDVIAALGTGAKPGDVVTVTLKLSVGGTAMSLTDSVRVVGGDGSGGGDGNGGGDHHEIEVSIHPDAWCNVSTGSITVFLHGAVADVDLSSIRLIGEDGTSLTPTSAPSRTSAGIIAVFSTKDAFATLTNPAPGTHHTVKVTFADGTATQTLTEHVQVGNGNCGGGDDGNGD